MRVILKNWDWILSILVAFAFWNWAKIGVWSSISSELVAFFGIQAAAVLPAMIFAAGLLRPDGVLISEIREYKRALSLQMRFWITLLSLDFITAILVIIGKATGWSFEIPLLFLEKPYNFSRNYSSIVAFFVSLTCLRMIPMINGISSLQKLNAQMIEQAIVRANLSKDTLLSTDKDGFKNPSGFGNITAPKK